jgi:hypothetical protein
MKKLTALVMAFGLCPFILGCPGDPEPIGDPGQPGMPGTDDPGAVDPGLDDPGAGEDDAGGPAFDPGADDEL